MIWLYWLIHLTGSIITYRMLRKVRDEREWFTIFVALFLASLSWLSYVIFKIMDAIENNPPNIPKPPKWL